MYIYYTQFVNILTLKYASIKRLYVVFYMLNIL